MKLSEAIKAIVHGDGITNGTYHARVDGGKPELRVEGSFRPGAEYNSVDDLLDACRDVAKETGSKWRVW
jgi:hypothetical protein